MIKIAVFSREDIVDQAVVFYNGEDSKGLDAARKEADEMLDGQDGIILEGTADLVFDPGVSKWQFPTERAYIG